MRSWKEVRKELFETLVASFQVKDLERLLRYECDRRLEEIVGAQANLRDAADAIVAHAEAKRWLDVLASGMQRYDPDIERVVQVGREIEVLLAADVVYRVVHADDVLQLNWLSNQPEREKELANYLTWVANRYSRLNLRGIEEREQRIHRLSLDDVYISLEVVLDPERQREEAWGRKLSRRQIEQLKQQKSRKMPMTQLLRGRKRLAITGGPGSGKTTFLHIIASSIAHALRSNDRSQVDRHLQLTGDLPIPIVVPLSEYNRYRRDNPSNGQLRTYITQHLRQNEMKLSDDFFEWLLEHPKQCLLLLDGLDEVADEDDRIFVRAAVENLAYVDEVEQMIVTSRTHAYYGETQLHKFRVAQVQPMQRAQIADLVARWCMAVYEDGDERETEQTQLLEAIDHLEAQRQARGNQPLIDTPLMVTIVAIVHYNEHRLPDQRVELYEKCVDVLLSEKTQRTDATRLELRKWGGRVDEKRQLLGWLAWKMMCVGQEAGRQVDERQLKRWLKPQIKLLYSESEVQKRLRTFIAAQRERGSLINESGGQYRFSHLTFQEYLCAFYLAEAVGEQQAIVEALCKDGRIGSSWWREVILLLVGYRGKRAMPRALSLIQALAQTGQTPETQLIAVSTVTTAFLELNRAHPETRTLLQDRLVELLSLRNVEIAPPIRATAGRILSQLGDPRPGVGVKTIVGGITIPDIVWSDVISAGEYLVGDYRRKRVMLSHDYRLARYPVTYQQYQCFLDAADYADAAWWAGMPHSEKTKLREQAFPYANHPRERVNWYQAVAFCRWLSDKFNLSISLPHEYEWEVAARYIGDGKVDPRVYPWGDDFDSNRLNNHDSGFRQTSAVGIFPDGIAPHLKLYDMSGNVWEWCMNKRGDVNHKRVDKSNERRPLRGGSWFSDSDGCRAAFRDGNLPDRRLDRYGFRVCCLV